MSKRARNSVGGPSSSLGTNGRRGDDDFDAWPVTKEEFEAATQRIVERLAGIRERDEALEKCAACGQPLPEGEEGN